MMRYPVPFLYIALLFGAAVNVRPAQAVIILTKGSDVPVPCYLVSQNETHVMVRLPAKSGQLQERAILRADILELLISVSAERLEALTPDQPRSYYDYAEELVEKQQDPEARDAAIRLYLIAAHLSPDEFGRRAMRGAAAVARRPAEEAGFRALSFLLDPAHDQTVLKTTATLPSDGNSEEMKDRQSLLNAARLLRRGEWTAARRVAERPEVKAAFGSVRTLLRYEDFLAACDAKNLSPALLRQLVSAELALDDAPADAIATEVSNPSLERWSRQIFLSGSQAVPALNMRTITEFDPEENIFQNGRWVRAKK